MPKGFDTAESSPEAAALGQNESETDPVLDLPISTTYFCTVCFSTSISNGQSVGGGLVHVTLISTLFCTSTEGKSPDSRLRPCALHHLCNQTTPCHNYG